VFYQVGGSSVSVGTSDIIVTAPTDASNTNMRVMDTTTKLFYSSDSGGTWNEVVSASGATWTSQSGSESCI